tara:strand:- start:686 stop:1159 length:474 start_codon:yes stop_codon:yes gene_type:complete
MSNSDARAIMEDLNYMGDSRVMAGNKGSWYEKLDVKNMQALVEMPASVGPEGSLDYDTTEQKMIPFKWVVCDTCQGKGTHVNPSIDAGGLSREDFDEDPDFAEEYTSGRYDVQCYECKGQRVVPEPLDEEFIKYLEERSRSAWESHQEMMAERRMGA